MLGNDPLRRLPADAPEADYVGFVEGQEVPQEIYDANRAMSRPVARLVWELKYGYVWRDYLKGGLLFILIGSIGLAAGYWLDNTRLFRFLNQYWFSDRPIYKFLSSLILIILSWGGLVVPMFLYQVWEKWKKIRGQGNVWK